MPLRKPDGPETRQGLPPDGGEVPGGALKLRAAADFLGISRGHLLHLLSAGDGPTYADLSLPDSQRRTFVFPRAALEAYLTARAVRGRVAERLERLADAVGRRQASLTAEELSRAAEVIRAMALTLRAVTAEDRRAATRQLTALGVVPL